jgi:hypothetical protein
VTGVEVFRTAWGYAGICLMLPFSIAFCLGLIGLVGYWIPLSLLRNLCDLWGGKEARSRALKELSLSVAALVAPCLLLSMPDVQRYAHLARLRWPAGLTIGVPLWAIMSASRRLARALIRLGSRVGRRPWRGEDGWGHALRMSVLCLGAVGGAIYYLWFAVALLNRIALDCAPPQ